MAGPFRKLVCAALLYPGQLPLLGRPFLEAARACAGRYKDRRFLAKLSPWPWISPRAEVCYRGEAEFGRNVFLDDLCVLYSSDKECRLKLGDGVSIYRGCVLHLGLGGSLEVGEDTHIQGGCYITAIGSVRIGARVQIAPQCRLYPYDHSVDDLQTPIIRQPIRRKGGIVIGDDAWLGVGVTVLDGVHIGDGAVIGAGAVVTRDVPERAVAAGVPARVLRMRGA